MRCAGLVAVLAACNIVDARRLRHSHHNRKRDLAGYGQGHGGPPGGQPYIVSEWGDASSTSEPTTLTTQTSSVQSASSAPTPTTISTSSQSVSSSGIPLTAGFTTTLSHYSSSSAASGFLTGYRSSSAVSAYPTAYGSGRPSLLPSGYSGNATASPTNTTSSANATSSASSVDFSGIRGVNIGGWLVLEAWMDSDVFANTSATDQYTFDQTDGAAAALQTHWDTYFTESDVQKIAAWGLNAMRIPIGYWAYNNTGTPYITGADAYMEKAIGWARQYGLKVLVDCHGSPGSQNGFDNSGRAGSVEWQADENLQLSISVLETMAEKYGSSSYADVVFGLELVNEPISWGDNNFDTTQTWAQQAYAAVKAKATNPDLIVVMHDSFQDPSSWTSVGATVNGALKTKSTAQFAIDTHLYQNQVASDSTLTQSQHIAKACNWSTSNLLPFSASLPVYVGEFSAQTNICANPDNTTVAGDSCTEEGCQCSCSVGLEDWEQPLKTATRQFFEAQVQTFEYAAQGWFLWSWNGPGEWGLSNLIENGVVGSSVTDVAFPDLCSFGNSTGS